MDMDEIRLAGLADLDGIMALEREAFPHGWSATTWSEQITEHYVALVDDGLGVIAMSAVAGTVELLRVIVAPGSRGRGLGRTLVTHGLEWAEHFGATEIFLEVSVHNQTAISLYESCGFTPLNRRHDYYGPGDDAIVYRRVILPPDVSVPSDLAILTESGSSSPVQSPSPVILPKAGSLSPVTVPSQEESCPNR